MLIPKKVKHRKWQKGRSRKRNVSTRGYEIKFGKWGIKALGSAWLNSRQIEAARRSITNYMKRQGRVWIRVFPDKPVTAGPPDVPMGGGKRAVDHYVFPVKPGRIIFEMDADDGEKAKEALRRASHKLPFKCEIVEKK